MRFKDKVAIVTGGANGIGRATALIIAREGGVVVAVDTNADRLRALEAETEAFDGRVVGRVCDVMDEAQVDALVGAVAEDFGGVDILVNVVGGSTRGFSGQGCLG